MTLPSKAPSLALNATVSEDNSGGGLSTAVLVTIIGCLGEVICSDPLHRASVFMASFCCSCSASVISALFVFAFFRLTRNRTGANPRMESLLKLSLDVLCGHHPLFSTRGLNFRSGMLRPSRSPSGGTSSFMRGPAAGFSTGSGTGSSVPLPDPAHLPRSTETMADSYNLMV